MRVSAILENPWRELRDAIRQAEVVHADETTWRVASAKQWLWPRQSRMRSWYSTTRTCVRLFRIPGRLTRTARQWTLRMPARWPWQQDFDDALTRIRALPALT